jgi:hypothetical protein
VIKIIDNIKHVADLSSGGVYRMGRSWCNEVGVITLMMVQECLLARPLDRQQASIHIGIEADAG